MSEHDERPDGAAPVPPAPPTPPRPPAPPTPPTPPGPSLPPSYPPAGGPPTPYPNLPTGPPPPGKGMAIAALVLAIVPLCCLSQIAAIVLAIVHLGRTKDQPGTGRGFAVAALVIAPLMLIATVVASLLFAVSNGSSTISSSPSAHASFGHTATQRGRRPAHDVEAYEDLRAGDCFMDPVGATSITTLDVVACSRRHDREVVGGFDLTGRAYPGHSRVDRLASDGCNPRVRRYVHDHLPARYTIRFFYPKADAWWHNKHVVCLIASQRPTRTSLRR